MESNRIEIQIPSCSSHYPIFKDIYAFLYKQGNKIPIHLQNSETLTTGGGTFYNSFSHYMDNILTQFSNKKKDKDMDISVSITPDNVSTDKPPQKDIIEPINPQQTNSIILLFDTETYTIDNIKGTKLYYLFLRNGECARWI